MNHSSRVCRASLVAAFAAAAWLTAGCSREKPNATRDMQKNQRQHLDEMDKISRKLEEEEKAKSKAPSEASPAAPSPTPSDPPPADPKEPAKPKDPG